MVDRKEIEYWISRLEKGESSFPSYAKLANLYAIRREMDGADAIAPAGYSMAAVPEPAAEEKVGLYGESDFLRKVAGKDPARAWAIMDKLMETLIVTNKRMYNNVMWELGRRS